MTPTGVLEINIVAPSILDRMYGASNRCAVVAHALRAAARVSPLPLSPHLPGTAARHPACSCMLSVTRVAAMDGASARLTFSSGSCV
jgi:hypothetical protein